MTKLINVATAARAIIAAMICVVAGSANAQQTGSVQEGRRLAREVCAECHAIDNAAGGSTNPNAPTFKDIANTPGTLAAPELGDMTPERLLRRTSSCVAAQTDPNVSSVAFFQAEDVGNDILGSIGAITHPSKWEKIICQRKPQSITRKHQSILRMPHAITEKRPSITRPEVTRRLHTMLT